MLERARSLEDARARQIELASAEFASLARHSADAQREVISSVETVLKSAAYIRASAGGISKGCDILRASLPGNLPWIRNILIAGGDGRIQCSTNDMFVGLDLSDRAYYRKAQSTHEFVFSDFLISRPTQDATVVAAYPVSAINRDVAQANIIMGFDGIARSNPDYYKLQVMNYILGGGGFASRLVKEVRSKAGLAYSVASYFQAALFPGSFQVVLETKNKTANEAIAMADVDSDLDDEEEEDDDEDDDDWVN